MIYFFAGAESRPFGKILLECGVKNILQSCFFLHFRRQPNEFGFSQLLLDSGGYTIRKTNAQVNVKTYAEYLTKFDVRRAINLDTLSMEESIENHKFLARETKATIIPVFHYSDWKSTKWRGILAEWAKEHPYICIAGVAAPNNIERSHFYEFCFATVGPKVKLHGLAATRIDDMLSFPFYSVDSTTWLNSERFGDWVKFENGRIIKLKSMRVEAKAKNPKFRDPNLLTFEAKRFTRQSIKTFLQFEAYATRLWATRGVTYVD